MIKKVVEDVEICIPEVSDSVVFVDSLRVEHDALVTAVHCNEHWSYKYGPCVNLLWVSKDSSKTDGYGRQIERMSSVVSHAMPGMAPGNYWKPK